MRLPLHVVKLTSIGIVLENVVILRNVEEKTNHIAKSEVLIQYNKPMF